MHHEVRKYFFAIFRKYAGKTPPTWEAFEAAYGHLIPHVPCDLPDITVSMLLEALQRWDDGSSAGMDGLRPAELRRLPPFLLLQLCRWFKLVEETGEWPEHLSWGAAPLLPKGEGGKPEQLRPITVLTALWRLWSGIRYRQLHKWQEEWVHPSLTGSRPGRECRETSFTVALLIEMARTAGLEVQGTQLDYTKCFDLLVRDILFPLAAKYGLPAAVLGPMRSFYSHLKRSFRLGETHGVPFRDTNSMVQGCSLTLLLVNMLVSVWARAVHEASPDTVVSAYVDDRGLAAFDKDHLRRALEVTELFDQLAGGERNNQKTWAWGLPPEAQAYMRDLGYEVKDSGILLGTAVQTEEGVQPELLQTKIEKVLEALHRLKGIPATEVQRENLIASTAISIILFGAGTFWPSPDQFKDLRKAVLEVLWGPDRRNRCIETLLSVLYRGHRVDPEMAMMTEVLTVTRRLLSKRPELRAIWEQVWTLQDGDEVEADAGPCARVRAIAGTLGWQWTSPFEFQRVEAGPLHLATDSKSTFSHEVRHDVKQWRMKSLFKEEAGGVTVRRANMKGLSQHVDFEVTLAKLRRDAEVQATEIPGTEIPGMLQSCLSGSLRSGRQLCYIGAEPSELCRFCSAPATKRHILWQCPHSAEVRLPFLAKLQRFGFNPEEATDALLLCGICNEPQAFRDAAKELDNLPDPIQGPVPMERQSADRVIRRRGRIVVWTDGAARRQQSRRFRRGGCGIYYAVNHPANLSFRLAGRNQGATRAEIRAALAAVRQSWDLTEVCIDNDTAFRGLAKLAHARLTESDPSVLIPVEMQRWEHLDLWRRIANALCELPSNQIIATKVTGHATEAAVAAGLADAEDRRGNRGADKLATEAAEQHTDVTELVAEERRLKVTTSLVQSMLIRVYGHYQGSVRYLEKSRERCGCCFGGLRGVTSTSIPPCGSAL